MAFITEIEPQTDVIRLCACGRQMTLNIRTTNEELNTVCEIWVCKEHPGFANIEEVGNGCADNDL